jgi:hypothetical protein
MGSYEEKNSDGESLARSDPPTVVFIPICILGCTDLMFCKALATNCGVFLGPFTIDIY